MLMTWALAKFILIHAWKTTHLVIPQIPVVMMIIEGGSTEGGLSTFVPQEDAGIKKGKQTTKTKQTNKLESMFSINISWTLDKCGEEMFLGQLPGLEPSNREVL